MPLSETNLGQLPRMIERAIETGAKRWLKKTVNATKRQAPVQTGATRSSVVGSLSGSSPDLVATIEAPTAQATFEEHGTKAHGINPRYKKFLRWSTRGGSVMIGRAQENWRSGGGMNAGRWLVVVSGTGGGKSGFSVKHRKTKSRWKSSGRSGGQYFQKGHTSSISYWLTPQRQWAVWHPGTKATHWFSTAIKAEMPWLQVEIKAAIREALGM
jgi:hypothetical protein